MSRILILYSTVDGQTLRICRRLESIAAGAGHVVTVADIDDHSAFDPALYDSVVIGASIRYGRHRPTVARYLRWNREVLEGKCAFFTVNVVARKPGKNAPDTNPYMRKLLKQIGWRPARLAVFAGRLDYPSYGFLDRQLIRFIMLLTGGPIGAKVVVEFTDWAKVDELGRSLG